jgi:mannonate dehydratase
LQIEAVENFDPAHWHDVLLDGPKRAAHIENVKTIIRRLGEAGIPIMGYNFSIAGGAGRVTGPFARGGAMSVGMEGPVDDPMPNGMVWNMVYDPHAPQGTVPPISTTNCGGGGPIPG